VLQLRGRRDDRFGAHSGEAHRFDPGDRFLGADDVVCLFQAFGLFNFALASAFVLGPVIQSAFVPLGEEGIDMGSDLKFSIYTGPSWVAAILAALNLLLYVPGTGIFKEYYIAAKEGALLEARSQAKNGGQSCLMINANHLQILTPLVFMNIRKREAFHLAT